MEYSKPKIPNVERISSLRGLEFDPDSDDLFDASRDAAVGNYEVQLDHFYPSYSYYEREPVLSGAADSGLDITDLFMMAMDSQPDANNVQPTDSVRSQLAASVNSSVSKPKPLGLERAAPQSSSTAPSQSEKIPIHPVQPPPTAQRGSGAIQGPVSEQNLTHGVQTHSAQQQVSPPETMRPSTTTTSEESSTTRQSLPNQSQQRPSIAPRTSRGANAVGSQNPPVFNDRPQPLATSDPHSHPALRRHPPTPAPRKTRSLARPKSPKARGFPVTAQNVDSHSVTDPALVNPATVSQMTATAENQSPRAVPGQNALGHEANPGAAPQRNQTVVGTDNSEESAMDKYNFYLQKGKLKLQKNEYSDSAMLFNKALQHLISARGENHVDVAELRVNIGRLYAKQDLDNEAIREMLAALDIYKSNGYSESHGAEELWKLHDALAQVYGGVSKEEESARHYEMAIRLLTLSNPNPPERLHHMRNNLGNAYKELDRLREAKDMLELAKREMLLIHNTPSKEMAKVHSSLGDICSDLKEYQQAIEELTQSVQIREKLCPGVDGEIERSGTHKNLASLYEKIGKQNMTKAHEHAEKADVDLESIMGNREKRDKLMGAIAAKAKDGSNSGGEYVVKLMADDMNKAKEYQTKKDHRNAIAYYEKVISFMEGQSEEVKRSESVSRALSQCYNNIGNAYRKVDQFSKAKKVLEEALKIRRRLYPGRMCDETASTLFNLGHLLLGMKSRRSIEEALKLHKECLEMYQELSQGTDEHKTWIVSLYRAIAEAYAKLKESKKSIDMYEHAKRLLTEDDDPDELRAICNNVGNCYQAAADFPEAEKNFQQAIRIAERQAATDSSSTLQNHLAASHNNLGVMYQTWKKYDKSIEHLKQSIHIRETMPENDVQAAFDLPSGYHNLANTYVLMDYILEAKEQYEKELDIRRKKGSDTTGVRVSLSRIYEKLGNVEKAEALLDEL